MRPPTASVVEAGWGQAAGQVGFRENGLVSGPGGFAIAPDGAVRVLDLMNDRILTYRDDTRNPSRITPVQLPGGVLDYAIDLAGNNWILGEFGRPPSGLQRIEKFDAAGRRVAARSIPVDEEEDEEGIDDVPVRLDANEAGVQLQMGDVFFDVATRNGRLLSRGASRASRRPGLRLGDANDSALTWDASGASVELELTRPDGTIRRAWSVKGPIDDLGALFLTAPFRVGLVVVLHPGVGVHSGYLVLTLDERGLADVFTVPYEHWTEDPLFSRFLVRDDALYQMTSTPQRFAIKRWRLKGRRPTS